MINKKHEHKLTSSAVTGSIGRPCRIGHMSSSAALQIEGLARLSVLESSSKSAADRFLFMLALASSPMASALLATLVGDLAMVANEYALTWLSCNADCSCCGANRAASSAMLLQYPNSSQRNTPKFKLMSYCNGFWRQCAGLLARRPNRPSAKDVLIFRCLGLLLPFCLGTS